MNITAELNAPSVRNDANTTHAVMSHIRLHHADALGDFHSALAVQEAIRSNDAKAGCDLSDRMAHKLRVIRQRFQSELNLSPSL